MNKIGNILKSLRKSHGFSIPEITKKLEETNIVVKQKTIYRWENNTCIPDIKTINILSHIYGVTLSSIYEDSKFCKTLNEHENDFMDYFRNNRTFKRIIQLLINLNVSEEL